MLMIKQHQARHSSRQEETEAVSWQLGPRGGSIQGGNGRLTERLPIFGLDLVRSKANTGVDNKSEVSGSRLT